MEIIQTEKVVQLLQQNATLVAVTKTVGTKEIEALYQQKVRHFGENRVTDFLAKVAYFKDKEDIQWHYIGAIQSRQVKKIINHIDYLHALCSESVAKEIEKHAVKPIQCFIQVNCSKETQKSGLLPAETREFYQKLLAYKQIEVVGFMTMAAHTDDRKALAHTFKTLREVRDGIDDSLLLSMGMSNDYEIALEQGSNFIRVGSALFE